MNQKNDDWAVFELFIANEKEYPNIRGTWIKFPVSADYLCKACQRIGIDIDENGLSKDQYFVAYHKMKDSKIPVKFVGDKPDLNEINYLAKLLKKLDEHETKKLQAAMDILEINDIPDVINYIQNKDSFSLFPFHIYEEDLGDLDKNILHLGIVAFHESCDIVPDYLYESFGVYLSSFVDYQGIGERIYETSANPVFTQQGFVSYQDSYQRTYESPQDIPDIYKLFKTENEIEQQVDDDSLSI